MTASAMRIAHHPYPNIENPARVHASMRLPSLSALTLALAGFATNAAEPSLPLKLTPFLGVKPASLADFVGQIMAKHPAWQDLEA